EALVIALASKATPLEHRRPTLGSAPAALGALFSAALFERQLSSPLYGAGAHFRVCGAALTLLDARLACARALLTDRSLRGDAEARERAAAALACDPG